MPDGFFLPVRGEAHCLKVDIGILSKECLEFVFELVARVDGAEHIGNNREAEIGALGVGPGRVYPRMDDTSRLCRADGQKFVPDAAVVAAEVAKAAQDQEP